MEEQRGAWASASVLVRVFERWPLPLVVIATDETVLAVNHACCAWTGFSREELIGQAAGAFELSDILAQAPLDSQDAESLPMNIVAYRHKDGSVLWGRDEAVVVDDLIHVGIARIVQTHDFTDIVVRRHREGRERWRIALAETTAHIATFEVDLESGVQSGSAEYVRMHLRPADFVPPPLSDSLGDIHPEDRALVRAALERADSEFDVTYRLLRDPANPRLIHTQGRTLSRPDGRPGWAVGIARDVTEERSLSDLQRHAEQDYRRALEAQQRRLEASQAAGQVGTWEIDLATGEVTNSVEYQRLHGEVVGMPDRGMDAWLADVHPEDREMMRATWSYRREYAVEYRWVRDPEHVRTFVEHGTWMPGEGSHPGFIVGTAHDITDARRQEVELRHLADHEPLTRLLNRGAFERAYESFSATRAAEDGAGALFMLDLDKFKHHNDTYGHQRGDEILSVVADALRGRLRDGDDVVARWGGDEFIALVPRLSLDQAERVASDLVRRVAERTAAASPDASNPVTISLGVVILDGLPDLATAVERVDKALYAAKNAGRNQWHRYSMDAASEGA